MHERKVERKKNVLKTERNPCETVFGVFDSEWMAHWMSRASIRFSSSFSTLHYVVSSLMTKEININLQSKIHLDKGKKKYGE